MLFLLIYFLSEYFHDGSRRLAAAPPTWWRSRGALGYFASLILHELGHALVARRLGIPIAGIDLWFFGGLSQHAPRARDRRARSSRSPPPVRS